MYSLYSTLRSLFKSSFSTQFTLRCSRSYLWAVKIARTGAVYSLLLLARINLSALAERGSMEHAKCFGRLPSQSISCTMFDQKSFTPAHPKRTWVSRQSHIRSSPSLSQFATLPRRRQCRPKRFDLRDSFPDSLVCLRSLSALSSKFLGAYIPNPKVGGAEP